MKLQVIIRFTLGMFSANRAHAPASLDVVRHVCILISLRRA
jgi:hypothetical protein